MVMINLHRKIRRIEFSSGRKNNKFAGTARLFPVHININTEWARICYCISQIFKLYLAVYFSSNAFHF